MVKGVADLNELDFDLMVRLIACGLYEKRQCNDKYSYSSKLFAGINRLAALATLNEQYDMLSDLHECALIENYAVKPVKTWFERWNSDFVKSVEKFDLYHTNALIELSKIVDILLPTIVLILFLIQRKITQMTWNSVTFILY